jgi:hypothetical protein
MLSPDRHHEAVPRSYKANLLFRSRLLDRCSRDPRTRAATVHACSRDLLFYVNCFVWQYNPRMIGRNLQAGPFITWDFQDHAFRAILDSIECHCKDDPRPHQHDLLIEKSREMGASWMCLIVMEWLWHFHPWMKFHCISRNEKAVEDDDPDSLFWKIDFILSRLPPWLVPKFKRRKLYYGNEDNGSSITGEASTGSAGVGGRATAMFIDEFSQIKEDFEVLHRTSDTTGCRIFNGTHRGTGTAFHELSQRIDQRKLQLHWTQHPHKRPGRYRYDHRSGKVEVIDKSYRFPEEFEFVMSEAPAGGPFPGVRSPWYDEQCKRKGSTRAIAMDLDIDPGGSVAQFFNALTIRSLIGRYARPPVWRGKIDHVGRLERADDGDVLLWIPPRPDGTFPPMPSSAGSDISTGIGATNSCLSVVNAETGEKVLEFATCTMPPEKFAEACVALLRLFRSTEGEPPYFAWEDCGPGVIFGRRVRELGYTNLYTGGQGLPGPGNRGKVQMGWSPAGENKRLLLEEYRAALDARHFLNHSSPALEECLRFRYTPSGQVEHELEVSRNDPTGARVNHGDRVIADALAWLTARGKQRRAPRPQPGPPVGSLEWRRGLADNASVEPWSEPSTLSRGW